MIVNVRMGFVEKPPQPGDTWRTYMPDGTKKAYIFGVRVPLRLAYFVGDLIYGSRAART